MIEVVNQGKCFKAEIYKEAINKIGEETYSRYMDYDEDILINYVIFQIAKSMKYVEKYAAEIGDDRRPFAVDTWEKAYEKACCFTAPLPEY